VEFSLNISAIYTKWCAQTFPPIFGLFAIFDRNFAKIVPPPSDEYENYAVPLKVQSLVKKAENASKSAYKRQCNACSNYEPLTRTVLRTPSVTKKNYKQKHRTIKDNAYPRDIVTRTPVTRVELITISTVTIRNIWHNSAADFFCVFENFRRKFANLVAPSTDGIMKCLVHC